MALNEILGKPDVILEVDGTKFPCHRDVLASQSPYFLAMFSDDFIEKDKDVIKIQGVDPAAMKVLLSWIDDTSQIDSLCWDEILVVLEAASMLQFESLQRSCEELLVQRWLSPSSCLLTAAAADQLSLTKLHHKASSLALWGFSEVRHTESFFDLSVDALADYLSQDSLATTTGEFEVFEALSSWIEHKMTERQMAIFKTISCVRLNHVSLSDLQSMLHYTCVTNSETTQQLIKCVLCIKEGNEIVAITEKAACSQGLSSMEPSICSGGCCDVLARFTGQKKPESSLSESCDTKSDESDEMDDEIMPRGMATFSQETVELAQNIISLPERQVPIKACIIGHVHRTGKVLSNGSEMPSYSAAKKTRMERNKGGTPYIFYWDDEKAKKPVPLLHLSKIDQGPVEAVGYSVLSRGHKIYVLGGEYLLGYGDWNKSVWKYNVWNETWSFETSLSEPRRHHSVVCLGDDLFVIGGCGRYRVIMDSVERYNFTSKTWYKCTPLPCALYSAAVCVHKGFIYVITNQIFCYYPSTDSWVTLGEVSVPVGSSFNTAMSDGSNIYLTGIYSSDLLRFDPDGERTITIIGQFKNFAGNSCLVCDKIYCFSEDLERHYVEVYNIKTSTFELLWESTPNDCRISFRKQGGCFPLVLY